MQVDVNGMAMHDLYRVLKRQSDLFIKRYGMAMHIKDHNTKVRDLTDISKKENV